MAKKSRTTIGGTIPWPGQESEQRVGALRSIAYLLHWSSRRGNKPIGGPAAEGLAHLLDQCIEDLLQLPKRVQCAKRKGRRPATDSKKQPDRRDIDELNRIFKLGEKPRSASTKPTESGAQGGN